MKADLLDLLHKRTFDYPIHIAAVETRYRQLRLTIAPWRPEAEEGERPVEEQIVLSFEGVQGMLDADTLLNWKYDEALAPFYVSPLSEQGWANSGISYETYCSEPLPEPLRLYALVQDYLWEAGAPRSPRDYFNMGTLVSFCAITQTSSYLLARAPKHLHQIISAELLRQSVQYTVPTTVPPTNDDESLFVHIGGMRFVCGSATAEM